MAARWSVAPQCDTRPVARVARSCRTSTMPPTPPDALLPIEVLVAWLDDEGIAPGAPISTEPLRGGVTNVMFRVQRGDCRLVVRRPAKRATDRADDGMRREYRILQALAGTEVPHPHPVA